jgi:drug/metabolite transporter (DMT)-like permease
MVVAGAILLAWHSFKHGLRFSIQRRDLPILLATPFLHIFVAFCADLWALQYMTSWESCFLYNLSPFIAAAISICFFGKRLVSLQWLAVILACAATVPLLLTTPCAVSGVVPIVVMILAVGSSASGWLLVERLINRGYAPSFINAFSMLIGGAAALVLSWGSEAWNPVPVWNWWPFIWQTAAIILASNILFYNFYASLLRRYDAVFMACAGSLTPVFALLFGWLFLGEELCSSIFFMVAASGVALYLFHRGEKQCHAVK